MEDPPLNPSQQVERIREILIGRQMNLVEERLGRLEDTIEHQAARLEEEVAHQEQSTHAAAQNDIEQLSRQLEETCRNINKHDLELQQNLSTHLEQVSSAMAARIDARIREVFQHLQTEIAQWKNQVDRDLRSVRDESVSRSELKNRFARLASAAMEDDPKPDRGFTT